MDSVKRMLYSRISLLRKRVRGRHAALETNQGFVREVIASNARSSRMDCGGAQRCEGTKLPGDYEIRAKDNLGGLHQEYWLEQRVA